MDLIKKITIPSPPTKYVDRKRTKIDPKTGKLQENVYYLTGNLFLSTQNYFIVSKILRDTKMYLLEYFKDLPELSKMRLEFVYQREDDRFDLDNKGYFWQKVITDILKSPSNRQVLNAAKKNRTIITTNTIKDDTVRYISGFSWDYKKGEHSLIINIYGELKKEELNLFSK